jgi:hypothetical protein
MLGVPSCPFIMIIPSYLVLTSYVDIFVAAKHGQLGVPSCTFTMKIPSYLVPSSYVDIFVAAKHGQRSHNAFDTVLPSP